MEQLPSGHIRPISVFSDLSVAERKPRTFNRIPLYLKRFDPYLDWKHHCSQWQISRRWGAAACRRCSPTARARPARAPARTTSATGQPQATSAERPRSSPSPLLRSLFLNVSLERQKFRIILIAQQSSTRRQYACFIQLHLIEVTWSNLLDFLSLSPSTCCFSVWLAT